MRNLLMTFFISSVLLTACAQVPDQQGGHTRYFNVEAIAKTDIDMVADTLVKQNTAQLKLLATKLYKRNPQQWKKTKFTSREAAIERIFNSPFPFVEKKRSTNSIRLAFDENYQGDRVLAFVAGLGSMLALSYNEKDDFYLFDSLDAQKLYNSARNIEVASWLLRTKRNQKGQLFLLSSGYQGTHSNQSYERIFGKLIGQQDSFAHVIATKTHRVIKNVIQSTAKLVFLPV